MELTYNGYNAQVCYSHDGKSVVKIGIEPTYRLINPLDNHIVVTIDCTTIKSWKIPRYHTIIIPKKFCRNKNTEPFLMKEYFKYPDDRFVQYEDKDFPMLFNLGMLQVLPKFYEDFKPIMVYTSLDKYFI